MSDLIYTDGSDYYEIYVGGTVQGGSNDFLVSGESGGQQTFFNAYKLL